MLTTVIQILGMLTWVLLIIWMIINGIPHIRKYRKSLKTAFLSLLKDLDQKIWMTVGLGILFTTLYLTLTYFGSTVFESDQAKLDFFFLLYKHPLEFVYFGLVFFVIISITICLVRSLIKNIYNNRKQF